MTSRITYAPEALQDLDEIDDWITRAASVVVARQFVSGVLAHIDSIVLFPLAGRSRDDIRSGLRTST